MKTPLTPQEKVAKKAAAKAAQVAAQEKNKAEEAARLAAYRAALPKRLAILKDMAESVSVKVEIGLSETGPRINFEYEDTYKHIYIDDTLSYDSDEWEVEVIEEKVNAMRIEIDAYNARRALAVSSFAKLSDEEKKAIKEHIHYI